MKSAIDLLQHNTNSLAQADPGKSAPVNAPSGFWRMARNNVRLLHQSPPIQQAPRNLPLPLSFNQERLWTLEQLQPGTSVHNLLHSFRLSGELNIEALKQSLNEIARRHEILRTLFTVEAGKPVQVILSEVSITINFVDLRDVPIDQQQTEVENHAIAQAETPFDLSQAPLWRVTLLQVANQEYILLRTIHHIIFDGMSHSVFVRELGMLYSAFVKGEPSPLLDLPVQYADFAWTQRQWLQGELLELQLNYWQQQLSGDVPTLRLPTTYSRSQALSYAGGMQSTVLSATLTQALKSLSAQQGVSLFVTLFAAFNTLLHQHTGQDDLVICSPVAGRHRAETRGLIGYFNNVVVLRTDLSSNPSFSELLEEINESFTDRSNYQDVPLQLVAELPNLKRTPLTRAMFVLQNTPTPSLNLAGLSVSSVFVNREIANFDLSLSLTEQNGQLTAALQYKTALFHPEKIARMLVRYEHLLELFVLNPELKLSELPSFKPVEASSKYLESDRAEYSTNFVEDSVMGHSYVAPRNDLETQIAQVWEELLGIQSIGVHDNFFDLGGHSLLAVSLFQELENRFGKQLPLSTLVSAPTIAQLAEYLDQSGASKASDVIVPLKVGTSKQALFLIHDGDGETLLYRWLAHSLSANVSVYGVQPYRSSEHPILHTRIEDIVAFYIEQIRAVQPEGPYFLGGMCAGGVLAFEIARQLQIQGQPIGMVAIIDAADVAAKKKTGYIASQRRDRFSKVFQDSHQFKMHQRVLFILNQVRKKVTNLVAYELQKRYKTTRDRTQLKLFRYCLDKHLPMPQWLHHIAVRTILVWAQAEYVPDTTLQGDVLLFRATQKSNSFDGTQIDDTPYVELYSDPLLGWGPRVTANVKAYDIPGGHSSMLQAPNVQEMAEIIQQAWDEAHQAKIFTLDSTSQQVA